MLSVNRRADDLIAAIKYLEIRMTPIEMTSEWP